MISQSFTIDVGRLSKLKNTKPEQRARAPSLAELQQGEDELVLLAPRPRLAAPRRGRSGSNEKPDALHFGLAYCALMIERLRETRLRIPLPSIQVRVISDL